MVSVGKERSLRYMLVLVGRLPQHALPFMGIIDVNMLGNNFPPLSLCVDWLEEHD